MDNPTFRRFVLAERRLWALLGYRRIHRWNPLEGGADTVARILRISLAGTLSDLQLTLRDPNVLRLVMNVLRPEHLGLTIPVSMDDDVHLVRTWNRFPATLRSLKFMSSTLDVNNHCVELIGRLATTAGADKQVPDLTAVAIDGPLSDLTGFVRIRERLHRLALHYVCLPCTTLTELGRLTALTDLDLRVRARFSDEVTVATAMRNITNAVRNLSVLERFDLDACPVRPTAELPRAMAEMGRALGGLPCIRNIHVQLAPVISETLHYLEILGDAILTQRPRTLGALVLGDMQESYQPRVRSIHIPYHRGLSNTTEMMAAHNITIMIVSPPLAPTVRVWAAAALQELCLVTHQHYTSLGTWRSLGHLPKDALQHLRTLTLRLNRARTRTSASACMVNIQESSVLGPHASVLPMAVRAATALETLTLDAYVCLHDGWLDLSAMPNLRTLHWTIYGEVTPIATTVPAHPWPRLTKLVIYDLSTNNTAAAANDNPTPFPAGSLPVALEEITL